MSKDNEDRDLKKESQDLIHKFEVQKLTNSRYINPFRVSFEQNNFKRVWDGVMAHSAVSCLIHNLDKNCIILVKQFRPVVFVNKTLEAHTENVSGVHHDLENLDWSKVHPKEGFTYELCAGICDKSKSLHETIQEEILEECGYSVDIEKIHKISQARSVGLYGAMHTTFYAEVTDEKKVSEGGGNPEEGEFIELYELPVNEIRAFVNDLMYEKPLGVMYALKWFLYEREEFFNNLMD